ncbi:MAG TPA: hypothetical protein ENK72_01430 [Epsilonproteobacteria bacterium]|nr:hypothetical protein [Campylobacterota bacterium]
MRILLLLTTLFLLSACSANRMQTTRSSHFIYQGIDFGESPGNIYNRGIVDGCTTAQGTYQKSHQLFQKSMEYEYGWFMGRNKCRKK